MTITCSNCTRDYDPGAQSFVVACPFCGHRTFNPHEGREPNMCKHEKLIDGYYGHDCADCGEMVYPYGGAPWDDDGDEWEDADDYRLETACVDCGAPGIDCCQCCGGYLCGMHSETGCGFCKACPTQEWVDEQQEAHPARRAAGEENGG